MFGALSRALLLGLITTTLGCAPANKQLSDWRLCSLRLADYTALPVDPSEHQLIDGLKQEYAQSPFHDGYEEIELRSKLVGTGTEIRIFVFNILYIDGSQAVFEVTPSDEIADRYIRNDWMGNDVPCR